MHDEDPSGYAWRVLGLLLRVLGSLAATVLCWIGAAGSFIAAVWAIHPWPGDHREPALAVAYVLLLVLLIVAPSVAWRFLLPGTRWWSAAPFVLLAAGAVGGFLFVI
ncbi:hypothetical protein [Krasilnikovia sp. MM14-A1259]|uniref:hypothetical protein n=1 Tax=Krasilnikovia sp. MM14-A1259 TaxID=3373539 RepID=UPI00399D2ED9